MAAARFTPASTASPTATMNGSQCTPLPEAPATRAGAPAYPEIISTPGTQSGPYQSTDRGEHREKVPIADHGSKRSILFHPHDSTRFIGYENCEIHRSDDAGERWTRLPVSVRFPEITTAPGANPAKRVLMMDASVNQPDRVRRHRGRRRFNGSTDGAYRELELHGQHRTVGCAGDTYWRRPAAGAPAR